MHLTGEVMIDAPRARVWGALNDPGTLARCIEGVERLERLAADTGGIERFEGRMNAKVGPVRAVFAGQVALHDVVAPESYRLVGEGKGGVAGFAKGEARVALEAVGAEATLLKYAVDSSVGGKLAQLGARLIEGTARSYAESFFARLKAEVELPDAVAEPAPPVAEPPSPVPPAALEQPQIAGSRGLAPYLWGAGLVAAVLLFLLWQWR